MLKLTSDVKLRQLSHDDQPALYRLMSTIYLDAYRTIWKDDGQWFMERNYSKTNLEKELAHPGSHYYFIEMQNKPIGILKFDLNRSPSTLEIPNATKLHRLYLHASYQGMGIAADLMHGVEAFCLSHQQQTIWLEVMEFKNQARRFYTKMGYTKIMAYTLDYGMMHPHFREIHILGKALS